MKRENEFKPEAATMYAYHMVRRTIQNMTCFFLLKKWVFFLVIHLYSNLDFILKKKYSSKPP